MEVKKDKDVDKFKFIIDEYIVQEIMSLRISWVCYVNRMKTSRIQFEGMLRGKGREEDQESNVYMTFKMTYGR